MKENRRAQNPSTKFCTLKYFLKTGKIEEKVYILNKSIKKILLLSAVPLFRKLEIST